MRKRIFAVLLLALPLLFGVAHAGPVLNGGRTQGLVLPEQNAQEEMLRACARFFKSAREMPSKERYEEEKGVERRDYPSSKAPDAVFIRTGNEYRWTATWGGVIERTYTAYAQPDGTVYRLVCEGPSFASAASWTLDDTETTHAFMRAWLADVGWQEAQIVEICVYPKAESNLENAEYGHEVLLWFPGGEEARVKVIPRTGEVRCVMWSEQAPSGCQTQAEENAWYERQARAAIQRYLGETVDAEAAVAIDTASQYHMNAQYPVWTWKTVELTPQDGGEWLYRVELNADGVRRVQRAYTGLSGVNPIDDADREEMLYAWDAQWALEDVQRIREVEEGISEYLQKQGIPHKAWSGDWAVGALLTYSQEVIAGKDTDVYLVFSYEKPEGTLYSSGGYIQVGYSLYQRRIAYVDLNVDSNG